MDDYENVFDPALLEEMTRLGSVPDRQELLKQRIIAGRGASQTPTPQGASVGGTYMAASPLEHMASALQRAMGYGQVGQGNAGMEASFGQQDKGRLAYAQALARAMQQAQQTPEPYDGSSPTLVTPMDAYRR